MDPEKKSKLTTRAMQRRLEKHLYLFLFAPLFFIVYPLIPAGMVLHGDLPSIETSLYSHKLLSTWIDYGSHHGFETLSRYPFIILGSILLNVVNLIPDIISKFWILAGFFAASFSFYFSSILLLRKITNNENILYLRIAAIVGSLFYAYNIWSFHKIFHWYLWIGYAILPLFFVSIIYAAANGIKWKYVLVAALCWSLASSTPHMAIFYGLIFAGMSIFFVFRNLTKKQRLVRIGFPLLSIFLLYLLINLYWIYPYVLYSNQETFIPSILVTEEQTEAFSRDSSFSNVIRLMQDWWEPRVIDPSPSQTEPLYPFWLIASFLLPFIAFSGLLVRKNSGYVFLFSCIALVGILLTVGTNAPVDLYSLFLFELPVGTTLRFIFRDPDKWAFLVAFGYSFLLTIVSFECLGRLMRLKYKKLIAGSFLFLILASITIYSYPTYISTSEKALNPIVYPPDFIKLNHDLTKKNAEKVFILWHPDEAAKWSKGKELWAISQRSSDRPNIMPYYPAFENYHNHLTSSILSNKTNNINNFIFPLGTDYILYNNDTLNPRNIELMKKIPSLEGLMYSETVGIFEILRTNNSGHTGQLNVPNQNIIVAGPLDIFASLNSVPSFSSLNSSLLFLDQDLDTHKKYEWLSFADSLIMPKGNDDLSFSFLDEKLVIEPFQATNRYSPEVGWSKSSITDPWHGEFHPFLADLDIGNWDFDYGKGLVMTKGKGSKLSLLVEVPKNGNYDIYARYMKNEQGGIMNLYVDDIIIDKIETKSSSNEFAWQKINDQSLKLSKGRHTLTLENVAGFNAVNIFALIPESEYRKLTQISQILANLTRNIFLLEPESDFYQGKGKDVGYTYLFSREHGPSFNRTVEGQVDIPAHADLMALGFLAEGDGESEVSYWAKNLEMHHASEIYEPFTLDPKSTGSANNISISEKDWLNNNLSMSSEINGTRDSSKMDDGNIEVKISKDNSSKWSIISTNLISGVRELQYYNYSLGISAKAVHQLHSKVVYFDSNKKELGTDFIFDGKDGTFEEKFSKTLLSPAGTKYIQINILVGPNPEMQSSYLVDNVNILPQTFIDENYENSLSSISFERTSPPYNNGILKVYTKQDNSIPWSIVSTNFIHAKERAEYNYSLDISAKAVHQLHSKVVYFDSNRKELGTDLIFDGKDGTFEEKFSKTLLSPAGTKYLQLKMFTDPQRNDSTYIINVKMERVIPPLLALRDGETLTETINENLVEVQGAIKGNSSLSPFRDVAKQTKPFPVVENARYNYSLSIGGKNITSLVGIALFRNSGDVVENSSKYGAQASGGGVLSLSPGSIIYTSIDVLKPSNYTMALRASNDCQNCSPLLDIDVEDWNGNVIRSGIFRLDNPGVVDQRRNNISDEVGERSRTGSDDAGLKWLYDNGSLTNTFLKPGRYDIKIRSNSHVDLDSFIMYSDSGTVGSTDHTNQHQTLESVFSQTERPNSGYISSYEKIDPTKYIVHISDAVRPFVLSLSEAFDPLWIGHVIDSRTQDGENLTIDSFPLYSITNGFYVNRTGTFDIVIEYQPQQWFTQAGVISLSTFIIAIVFLLSQKLRTKMKNRIKNCSITLFKNTKTSYIPRKL
jgi:hypothetical protein